MIFVMNVSDELNSFLSVENYIFFFEQNKNNHQMNQQICYQKSKLRTTISINKAFINSSNVRLNEIEIRLKMNNDF